MTELVTITDPDELRLYGWGKDGKPLPSYVTAAPVLWEQWRRENERANVVKFGTERKVG